MADSGIRRNPGSEASVCGGAQVYFLSTAPAPPFPRKKGQCHEVKVVMHSTEEPGKFSLCESLRPEPLPEPGIPTPSRPAAWGPHPDPLPGCLPLPSQGSPCPDIRLQMEQVCPQQG